MTSARQSLHTVVLYAVLLVGPALASHIRAADAVTMVSDPLYSQWADAQADSLTNQVCVDSLIESLLKPATIFHCAAEARSNELTQTLADKYGPYGTTSTADIPAPPEHREALELEYR